MEKRREIPGKPNSAPKADVDRVAQRIVALGYKDIVDAAEKAGIPGISRSTAYRFRDYTASVGKLRELEEWALKEERRRNLPAQPTTAEMNAQMREWTELGEQLNAADPVHFQKVMEGLRDMVEATRLTQAAIRKMLRATPDRDR